MDMYELRTQLMIAKYKWGFFRSEIKKQEKKYANWKANQKPRAERLGLEYLVWDELYEDYIIGRINRQTFARQKKLYNLIIADNWHRKEKLDWLHKEGEKYRREVEAWEKYIAEEKRRKKNEQEARYQRKKNGIKRRTYDMTKNRSKYNQPKKKGEKK